MRYGNDKSVKQTRLPDFLAGCVTRRYYGDEMGFLGMEFEEVGFRFRTRQ